MTKKSKDSTTEQPGSNLEELSIDRPRLTPQGRTDPSGKGEDSTESGGGVKEGQKDKAGGLGPLGSINAQKERERHRAADQKDHRAKKLWRHP